MIKKVLAGSIIAALGITNAYANAYRIIDKDDGSELCQFTTAIGQSSYGDQIIDKYGRVTEFSCGNWPYGAGPGALFYGEGFGSADSHNSPSALISSTNGLSSYNNANIWRIGNFFYGEELKYDFNTYTWTQFDSHQRVVKSGGFKVKQIPSLGSNQKSVACKLYGREGIEAGVAVYTYDPSTTEAIYFNGSAGGGLGFYSTNFATKSYVYATLKGDAYPSPNGDGSEVIADDYMFTHTFEDIWIGETPGGINTEHPAGYETIDSGWHKYRPHKCGNCELTDFSMNFNTALEGTWSGRRVNNGVPFEHNSNDGVFTCSIQPKG